ncbi:MAG: hypothetical protein P9L98_06580 [Candidatus Kaelpia imicola]|nr:hypothetical protein [Candidatus Kaelpia imicola]
MEIKHFFIRGSDWTEYDPLCYFIPREGLFRYPSERGWNWGNPIKEKKKDEIRIISIGDSTTYGNWVTYKESYPYLLEQLLKKKYSNKSIKVLNAGLPGGSSRQIKRFFQLYLIDYQPDIVIWRKGAKLTDRYEIPKLTAANYRIRNLIWSGLYHLRIFRVIAVINDRGYSKKQKWYPAVDRVYDYIMGLNQIYKHNYSNGYKSDFCIVKEICRKNKIKYALAVDYLRRGSDNELYSDYREYKDKKIEPAVNTFNAFKQRIDQTSIDKLFVDSCHLTEIGTQTLAKEIFDFLIDNNWIDDLILTK